MSTDTVMNIRLVYNNAHRESKCVNHNMFLAPLDLLVAVNATIGIHVMGRLDTSGVYDSKAGRVFSAHQSPSGASAIGILFSLCT